MFGPMFVDDGGLVQLVPIVLALLGFAAGWYWIYRIVKDIEEN